SKGRVDMLRKGMGLDLAVVAQGVTADDVKRVWPNFVAPDARNWFGQNVVGGKIDDANMKFDFPVGTLPLKGEDKPIPQNGIFVEMTASGLKVKPAAALQPIELQGKAHLQVHDADVTISADGGMLPTDKGNISVANASLEMSPADDPDQQIVEISGDMS